MGGNTPKGAGHTARAPLSQKGPGTGKDESPACLEGHGSRRAGRGPPDQEGILQAYFLPPAGRGSSEAEQGWGSGSRPLPNLPHLLSALLGLEEKP